MNYSVIIPCAGMGKRMGLGYNKLLYSKDGVTIIEKTVSVFKTDTRCHQIILVVNKHDENIFKKLFNDQDKIEMTLGGKERQDSVYQGLLKAKCDYVLIHDGARPYLSLECIDRLLNALIDHDACLLMVPAKDTIKIVQDGYVVSTPDRNTLMHAQTPQAFKKELILKVYQKAQDKDILGTDDASLVELFGGKVKAVEGDYGNIKITTIGDLS